MKVFSISNTVSNTLVDINEKFVVASDVIITNTNTTTDADVHLALETAGGAKTYILSNLIIPVGTSLILNKEIFYYNRALYKLAIKLDAGTVDIILK